MASSKYTEWTDCTTAAYKREYENLREAQLQDPTVKELAVRVKRTKDDYEAEGCYWS